MSTVEPNGSIVEPESQALGAGTTTKKIKTGKAAIALWQARKQAHRSKLPSKSELLEVERRDIVARANQVWGNAANAASWLDLPHPELQGATPRSLMKTTTGAAAVAALLAALDEGFPV